jgi:hypothetical protein
MKREILLAIGGVILGSVLGEVLAAVTNIHPVWLRITVDVLLGGLGLGIVWLATREVHRKRGAIQVFLPDWKGLREGDFYQDGAIQKKGFDQAESEARGIPDALDVGYNGMHESVSAQELLASMQEHYRKGSTYFIMTMSDKVENILPSFKAWHRQCVNSKAAEPILIVTVASAPGLADAENGVVRWYIRSQEESQDLANHLERYVQKAATFAITHTPGSCDSTYGAKGVELFCRYFDGEVPSDLKFYVTARTAKAAVQAFFSKCSAQPDDWPETGAVSTWPGVFVVGYGDMVRNTVTELIQSGYAGYIACTSTFTDPQWRPQQDLLKTTKAEIFTVRPRLRKGGDHFAENDRNVVFLFARKTLLRTLNFTAGNTDSKTFLAKWTSVAEEGSDALDQIYLQEGDIEVQLKVLYACEL